MLLDNNLIRAAISTTPSWWWTNPLPMKWNGWQKAFGRKRSSKKRRISSTTWSCVSPMNQPVINCSMWWAITASIGYPIQAHIIANRPGHSSNGVCQKIQAVHKENKHTRDIPIYSPNPGTGPYTQQQIEKTLPHRFPFILVDGSLNSPIRRSWASRT